MAYTGGDVRRTSAAGTALAGLAALLTALACLAFAELRDPRPLSLTELEQADAVLMSCEDTGLSSTGEPLWCADPSAPHCSPAAPDTPSSLACERPDVTMLALDEPERPYVLVSASWPAPPVDRTAPRVELGRLERPPRA